MVRIPKPRRLRFNKIRERRRALKGTRQGAYVVALDGRVHVSTNPTADHPKTLCGRAATGVPSNLGPEFWPLRCPTCRDARRNLLRGRRAT